MLRRAQPLIVMGVSGCGKSTVAAALASEDGLTFVDADALHPAANVAKMAAGIPLVDEDRWPWLDLVGEALADQRADVIACSALRRAYRDRIRSHVPTVFFAHLQGSRELIADRLDARSHEFMPTGLLASQFAALEPLERDEGGLIVPVEAGLGDQLQAIRAAIAAFRS